MTVLEAAQQQKQAQLDLFQHEHERLKADMEVPLRLKQGQVEIEPQDIVDGDLDLALLVSKSLIQVGSQCGTCRSVLCTSLHSVDAVQTAHGALDDSLTEQHVHLHGDLCACLMI